MGNPQVAALSVQIVEQALTQPPADLRQAADQGSASAQLSYSIVLRYGLKGSRTDVGAADAYRRQALASRGTTTTAIYVPTGKHSGHTQLISIPRYDISGGTAKATDDCVDALQAQIKPEAITNQCGGVANYIRLAGLWSGARS
jgi:hypothetical protein